MLQSTGCKELDLADRLKKRIKREEFDLALRQDENLIVGRIMLIKPLDEIQAELFKSLKDNAIKIWHSLCRQIWKTQQWPQDWKRSVLIPIPKKGSTKERANHWTTALTSHASKVMLVSKILHARLQPDVQAGYRKGTGTRDRIVNIRWTIQKARKFQKNIYLFH